MRLDATAAAHALDAQIIGGAALPDGLTIVTDTRAIGGGETFLALHGERYDGHDFVELAFERGVAACIVSDASVVPAGRPALVVADTLVAYLGLAQLARRSIAGPVVAISGSAGKTTTKSLLQQLLTAIGRPAIATPENENNEIGVSKFLLALDDGDSRVAIVEMGARKFLDLDVLVHTAQPDIGVLTNIGEAHLEIFGSHDRLAETKWGLFRGGARAVLGFDDTASRERAGTLALTPLWFGAGGGAPPPGEPGIVVADARRLIVHDGTARRELAIETSLPGMHNLRNLAAALAAAVALHATVDELAPQVVRLRLPGGRYEAFALPTGARLIFDAYNASASGTLASLDAFAHEDGRRIAVIGSMAELGMQSSQMHRSVGAAAAHASDILLAGGDFAADLVRGAYDAGAARERVVAYGSNAEAVAWLRANGRGDDVILLKGSRRYAMEEIANALGAPVPHR